MDVTQTYGASLCAVHSMPHHVARRIGVRAVRVWLDYRDRQSFTHAQTFSVLRGIASEVDVIVKPEAVGFATSTRLYPGPAKRWQRLSASPFEGKNGPRKVAAVCWHGHYAFMSLLFARYPHARIVTGVTTYNGRKDFFHEAESTGDRNVGAPIYPRAMRDICTCADCGDDDPNVYDHLLRPEHDTAERAEQRAAEGDKLTCPECGAEVWDGSQGHKLAKCWNAEGHASGAPLAFDTMNEEGKTMLDKLLRFEVLWYSGGPGHAPNRCIGRDVIRKRDLSAAITWAANRIKSPRGNESAAMAHGFYVRSVRVTDNA